MSTIREYEIKEACNDWQSVTFNDIDDAKQYLTDRYGSTFTGKSAIETDVILCGTIGIWSLSSKLTKDAEAQVKKGICPKCGLKLLLDVMIESDNESHNVALYQFDHEQGKWTIFDFEFIPIPTNLYCVGCGFECTTDLVEDELISKIDMFD